MSCLSLFEVTKQPSLAAIVRLSIGQRQVIKKDTLTFSFAAFFVDHDQPLIFVKQCFPLSCLFFMTLNPGNS